MTLWDLCSSEATAASTALESPTGESRLLETILERDNMRRALKRVRRNKGAPGVDRMTVKQLPGYLRRHWEKVKAALLDGTYRPQPVRRTEIPKPSGGVRLLGIPAVLDRMIQQAVAQVLGELWEPTFSDSSFGFRPGRNQHDAVRRAQAYVRAGHAFVVDLDLSKFFDRVNHDRLMSRLATRLDDTRVLKLLRAFLESGVMVGGLTEPTDEGVPQGGPLSPLLSNIVLDELDAELARRGLRFVRYADDVAIYVRSERAGARVLQGVTRFLETRMKLKVNAEKSGVNRPWTSKLLGFTFTPSITEPRIAIHHKTIARLKQQIRDVTRRRRGRSFGPVVDELTTKLCGWWNYFRAAEAYHCLFDVAKWIYRRLRALRWSQWKHPRKRARELMKRGVARLEARRTACTARGPWRMSRAKLLHIALPRVHFDGLGLTIPWLTHA